jgi:rubrerythrin
MNKTKPAEKRPKARVHPYYKCPRCGYVSIIKESFCPVCAKDGVKIKVK